MDIDYFLKQTIDLQYEHSKKCTGGKLEFMSEHRRGLVSVFFYKCNICERVEKINSEKMNMNNNKSTLNTAAVWGCLSTGSTYAHLEEFLSILDIPAIGGNMFFEIQRKLGFVS